MKKRTTYVSFSPETIEQVRQLDLLTYLRTYEPDNLVRVTSNVYCTREHDSLKISNGKWYWWSRGFGGASALDYLIKVREMHFTEAVQLLTGEGSIRASPPSVQGRPKSKALYLPAKNESCNQVLRYLVSRGIDETILLDCIAAGTIYESAEYHHAVFIGKDDTGQARFATCRSTMGQPMKRDTSGSDDTGQARFATCRSTMGQPMKRDASGSDKRYSFRLVANQPCTTLHLFEAAIDLLSYATYSKQKHRDYHRIHLLSLAGVYQPKQDIKSSKIPVALTEFLQKNPQIKTIYLHLDNDKAGRLSTKALTELLKNQYEIVDAPPPVGKDVNDFLLYFLRNEAQKAHRRERDTR